MLELEELLDRVEDEDDDSRPAVVGSIARAFKELTGCFESVAVVRGGRVQLILHRRPGEVRLLIAASANEADRAVLCRRMDRDRRILALAGEVLALALALPRGRWRALGERARRIVELGAELAAAA